MTIKLMAAVPTHSGSIHIQGAESLLDLQRVVLDRGGQFTFRYESGATVSLVRNAIVAAFLASDAEMLLMLDADQVIAAGAIARMIDFQKPVVGAIYPKRKYDWSQVRPGSAVSADELVYQAMSFVGWLETDGDGRAPIEQGFCRAEHLGTGIMLIRREVFERLGTHYPDLRGRGFAEDAYPGHGDSGRWGFFNPIDNDEGIPLSEDISFCHRWRAAGGELWADVTAVTAHFGTHPYAGSYVKFLDAVALP